MASGCLCLSGPPGGQLAFRRVRIWEHGAASVWSPWKHIAQWPSAEGPAFPQANQVLLCVATGQATLKQKEAAAQLRIYAYRMPFGVLYFHHSPRRDSATGSPTVQLKERLGRLRLPGVPSDSRPLFLFGAPPRLIVEGFGRSSSCPQDLWC